MRASPTRIVLGVGLFAATAALAGCQAQKPAPPAPPPPKVTVARPVSCPVQGYYEYNGHLDAVEMVEVKARVKGLLQDIHFVEGEEVVAAAPLYTIDPREYRTAVARATADVAKADADISNWAAQIKLAEAELGRINEAVRRGAGSVTDQEKAAATVEVNKAQYAVAKASKDSAAAALQTANIQLGYTDIRAPIAGRINRTMVTRGNLVGQDQPTMLTTIVSLDPLFVYFDAPEQDLVAYQRALRARTSADVQKAVVEVGIANDEGFPHRGEIDFRENRVDAGTGTVRIRGRIPNPPAPPTNARVLYPGLYARVRVPNGSPVARPVVPEEALMTGQEGRFVYVVGAENKIEKRTVVVGTRVWQNRPVDQAGPPGWALANPNPSPPPPDAKGPPPPARMPVQAVIAIEKGLTTDDVVVVTGLQKARPGAPVAPDTWELRAPSAAH